MDEFFLKNQDDTTFINLQDDIGWYLLLQDVEVHVQIEITQPKSRVIEGSTFPLIAYFRSRDDKSGSLPDTVRYRIDCLTTGDVVRDWTSLTPANSIEIDILPADNAIINNTNKYERKQIIVQANSNQDDQINQFKVWRVKNVRGIGID